MKLVGLVKKILPHIRKKKPFCSAVVLAAGSSTRMESEDKILLTLMGRTVLLRSLDAFESSACIDEIVVVCRPEKVQEITELAAREGISKVSAVVCGGSVRAESSLNGVLACSKKAQVIAIHDGARPLVTQQIIEDAVKMARRCNAAVPAVAAKDTLKTVENGVITGTPPRSQLYHVQTPQVFDADLIKGALTDAIAKNREITDDASAVEALGFSVCICQGSWDNIKITTKQDLVLCRAVLQEREAEQCE